ncbi:MAG: hypothetical protein WC069_00530 [Candidatus Shapirobacteria bacterium]
MVFSKSIVCPENCSGCDLLRKFTTAYGCEGETDPTALDCNKNKGKEVPVVSYAVSSETGLTEMVKHR